MKLFWGRRCRRGRGCDQAFSLIEILVVLAIIGMLVAVLVSNTGKIFGQSQEAVAKIFVRDSVKTPLIRYRIDVGDYPSTTAGLAALVTASGNQMPNWRGPYLDASSGKTPVDPWGEAYEYRYPGIKNSGGYDLFSKGPDKAVGTADDIGNW
jgi:general secretion pathway protein G